MGSNPTASAQKATERQADWRLHLSRNQTSLRALRVQLPLSPPFHLGSLGIGEPNLTVTQVSFGKLLLPRVSLLSGRTPAKAHKHWWFDSITPR